MTDAVLTTRPASRGAWLDPIFEAACLFAATVLLAALAGVVVSLAIGGWPALSHFGLKFFVTTSWNPVTEVYGAAGPIIGTLVTSFLALAMALPVAWINQVTTSWVVPPNAAIDTE